MKNIYEFIINKPITKIKKIYDIYKITSTWPNPRGMKPDIDIWYKVIIHDEDELNELIDNSICDLQPGLLNIFKENFAKGEVVYISPKKNNKVEWEKDKNYNCKYEKTDISIYADEFTYNYWLKNNLIV